MWKTETVSKDGRPMTGERCYFCAEPWPCATRRTTGAHAASPRQNARRERTLREYRDALAVDPSASFWEDRPDNHPTRSRDLASERPPRHLTIGMTFDREDAAIRNNRTHALMVDAWYGRRPSTATATRERAAYACRDCGHLAHNGKRCAGFANCGCAIGAETVR